MNADRKARASRHIRFSLILAAVMVGTSLLLALARKQGWIDAEQLVRGYNIVMGLAFATYGNFLPKLMHENPPRTVGEATLAQAMGRVTSWAMTLAFLTWAALWAFAPRDLAHIGSLAAVGACVIVVLGYIVWKCVGARTSGNN